MTTLADIEAMPLEERLALLRRAVPRMPGGYTPQVPHPPQALFLNDLSKEAFYGGSAGPGKSSALLMAALQFVDVPRYSALILRRTYTDLMLPGALMERANQWLRDTPARPVQGGKKWIFPSGSQLQFGSLQFESDLGQYKSSEFQFIGFDELTEFPERSYTFMFSRLRGPAVLCTTCQVMVERVHPGGRSVAPDGTAGTEIADSGGWVHKWGQTNYASRCERPRPSKALLAEYPPSALDGRTTLFDVPLRMRSASNPGGPGHAWVRDRFVEEDRRKPGVSYYPARLVDNPSIDQQAYIDSLSNLTALDRSRLLDGNWQAAEGGLFLRREWFPIVSADEVPAGARLLRYWDLAATEPSKKGRDPDWTVGALMAMHEGMWWIVDVVRRRGNPAEIERLISATASQDGTGVRVRMEQEPGASGKSLIDVYRRRVFVGYDFNGEKPTGDKETRANPLAAAAGAGNVRLVAGAWNRDLLDEFEAFPTGPHDDQVDACAGAMFSMANVRRVRLVV